MEQEETIIAESYWVIPVRIMAVEYPSAREEKSARKRIHWLVRNKLNHFIDLTEPGENDLPSYLSYLAQEETITGLEITYQQFPIENMRTPAHAHMRDILDAIDSALNAGKNIYLHCYGGIGRTGTVVGCYLVRHGMEGSQALKQIARLRVETPGGWRISPETYHQHTMVMDWKG